MPTDVNYSLEALRELKSWNMWVLGIAGTSVVVTKIFGQLFGSGSTSVGSEDKLDTEVIVVASAGALMCAIVSISAIPSLMGRMQVEKDVDPLSITTAVGLNITTLNWILGVCVLVVVAASTRILWRRLAAPSS